ncbi:MAG: hypothetical protein JKY01_09450 [Pseudomonadales bacterium]|nr:hypothetical protein [Pseudomonadales bacterium]
MKKEIIRSEWPVGAILKVRDSIPDRSLVSATVTILGPVQDVLGESVQVIEIHGVKPPFPQSCFLARPCDLWDFSNGSYDCFADSRFNFKPSWSVWGIPLKQNAKV